MTSTRLRKFLLVGASNAALHFTVLNLSYSFLHTSKLTSSIIATVCAMFYSFLLNKNFVFRSKATIHEEVIAFVLVTASGVLFIHNLFYSLIVYILEHNGGIVGFLSGLTGDGLTDNFIIINLSTVIGAAIALAWNYNGYKRFVFTSKEVKDTYEENQPTRS